MWTRAQQMLEETEQIWRQFFRLAQRESLPCWEPPLDVFETPNELQVVIALPGVAPHEVEVELAGPLLAVRAYGEPALPSERARILRMELPRGRFQRTLQLPPGAYHLLEQRLERGCLLLRFARMRSQP